MVIVLGNFGYFLQIWLFLGTIGRFFWLFWLLLVISVTLSDFGIFDRVYPHQPSISKSQNPYDVVFEFNENLYSENAFINPELITVELEGQLRSLRLANLFFRPIDYNPISGIIKVVKDFQFTIQKNFLTLHIKFHKYFWGL